MSKFTLAVIIDRRLNYENGAVDTRMLTAEIQSGSVTDLVTGSRSTLSSNENVANSKKFLKVSSRIPVELEIKLFTAPQEFL